jgi:hypothetical protein
VRGHEAKRSATPGTRVTIEGGPEGLEIVIPAKRNPLVIALLGFWLVAWFMGETTALAEAVKGGIGRLPPILVFWLLLWTAGGVAALYIWLWTLVGKERVLIGASTLRMKRDILGFGRTRVYELRKIGRLQVVPQSAGSHNRDIVFKFSGLAGGAIEFEYELRAIRFGFSLDEAEAGMVVERMKQRYAFRDMPAPA